MKALLIGTLILISVSVGAQEFIQGQWQTGRENTIIEIAPVNGEWFGKIKSSDNEKVSIGKVILKDLKKKNDKWPGTLFVVKKQAWYNVEITPHKTVLDLKIFAGFLTNETRWTKIK
jgi:hypothetical protein